MLLQGGSYIESHWGFGFLDLLDHFEGTSAETEEVGTEDLAFSEVPNEGIVVFEEFSVMVGGGIFADEGVVGDDKPVGRSGAD